MERQQAWLSEVAVTDSLDGGMSVVGATLAMTTGGARAGAMSPGRSPSRCRSAGLAMAARAMGYRLAWIVADAVAGLDEQAKAAVEARVASRISGQSWAAFRRTLRRAVLAAAPDVVLAEHTAR